MDAVEAAGRHVVAHRPQLEAAAGPEQHIVQHQTHHHGDHKAPGETHARDHAGQAHQLVHRWGLGHAGIAHPAGIQHAHEQRGHIVQHDGDDHLVLAAANLQQAGDHAPDTAGQRTGQQRQHHAEKAGDAGKVRRNECGDGAHQELTLTAQIEHAALIGKAGAQGGEHQGRGLGQGSADIGLGAEGALKQVLHCGEGVGAQRRHDDAANDEGQQNRQQRNDEAAKGTSQFFHITAPPLICPSWRG